MKKKVKKDGVKHPKNLKLKIYFIFTVKTYLIVILLNKYFHPEKL